MGGEIHPVLGGSLSLGLTHRHSVSIGKIFVLIQSGSVQPVRNVNRQLRMIKKSTMIRAGSVFLLTMLAIAGYAQKTNKKEDPAPGNSLLWKVEGNGLSKPTWLFGTIHMLCKDDAVLSDNMRQVISDCDVVYMEMDLDNIFEMMGAMSKMKMTGDTTLRDLLTEKEYSRVKHYFEEKSTIS